MLLKINFRNLRLVFSSLITQLEKPHHILMMWLIFYSRVDIDNPILLRDSEFIFASTFICLNFKVIFSSRCVKAY